VTNLSLGGGAACSVTQQAVINFAYNASSAVVAPAGNEKRAARATSQWSNTYTASYAPGPGSRIPVAPFRPWIPGRVQRERRIQRFHSSCRSGRDSRRGELCHRSDRCRRQDHAVQPLVRGNTSACRCARVLSSGGSRPRPVSPSPSLLFGSWTPGTVCPPLPIHQSPFRWQV